MITSTSLNRGSIPLTNATTASKSLSCCGRLVAYWITLNGGVTVKEGYRLIIVDKDGVLVSEFQLTENALAQPEAFVAGIKESIEHIEEEEP